MDICYELAIRNAIRRHHQAAKGTIAGLQDGRFTVSAVNTGTTSAKATLKQRIKLFSRALRRRIRNYLTKELSSRLENLHGKIDRLLTTQSQMNELHSKVDNLITAQSRLEELHGKVDTLITTQSESEELRSKVDSLFASAARVEDLRRQFDQLQLRVDQLVSRMVIDMDTATVMVRTPYGYLFAPKSDSQLLALLAESGHVGVEPGTCRLLLRLIEPGMTVVDAGANVGILTLPIARAVGKTGRVLAFEPTPSICSLLRRTILLNDSSDRVTVYEIALGRISGRATLHLSSVAGHNSLYAFDSDYAFATPEQVIEVELRRLDDVVPAGTRIHVIKLDVEGSELDVLFGMERVLAENPELAIVAEFGPSHLKRTGQSAEDWTGAFAERGFDLFTIDESNASVSPCDAAQLMNIYSTNILALRRASVLSGKLGL